MAAGAEKLTALALRDATDTLEMLPGETLTLGRLGTNDKRDWLSQAWPAVHDLVRKPLDLSRPGWGLNIRALAEAARSVAQDRLTDGMQKLLDHDVERGLFHDEGPSLAYLAGNAGSRLAVMHLPGGERAQEAIKQLIQILSRGWTGSEIMLPCARNSWSDHNTAAVLLGVTHMLDKAPGPRWWSMYPAGVAGAIWRKLSHSTQRDLSFDGLAIDRVRLHQPIDLLRLTNNHIIMMIPRLHSYDNWTGAVISGDKWTRLGTPFTHLNPGPGQERILGWYPSGPVDTRIDGLTITASAPRSRYGAPSGPVRPELYSAPLPSPVSERYTIGGPGTLSVPTGQPEPDLDDTPPVDDEPQGWNIQLSVWVGRDKAGSEDEAWEWVRDNLLNGRGQKFVERG